MEDLAAATPDCSDCLLPLEVAGECSSLRWECGGCGFVAIAAPDLL
jgi:hypothetical protein